MALKRHLQSILAVLSFAVGRAGPASTSRTTQTPHVRPVDITWEAIFRPQGDSDALDTVFFICVLEAH